MCDIRFACEPTLGGYQNSHQYFLRLYAKRPLTRSQVDQVAKERADYEVDRAVPKAAAKFERMTLEATRRGWQGRVWQGRGC